MWIFVEKVRVHQSMMAWVMVFGVVGSKVGASGLPINLEVALVVAITDPVEEHVDFFRPFMLDGVVGKSNGCGVVNLYGSGGLGISEFFKCCMDC